MQDNFDKAWRDKLAGYQAPADPQDWAAMSAMLDAKAEKRTGMYWWALLGVALLITIAGITYQGVDMQSFAMSGEPAAINNRSNGVTGADDNVENHSHSSKWSIDKSEAGITATTEDGISIVNGSPNNNNNQQPNGFFDVTQTEANNVANDSSKENTGSNSSIASSKGGKGGKSVTGNKNNKDTKNVSKSKVVNSPNTTDGKAQAPSSPTRKGSTNKANTGAWGRNIPATDEGLASNEGGENVYEAPSTSISVKQLKNIPNPSTISLSRDTSSKGITFKFRKAKPVSHYLGLSTGWVASRVDRSGDYQSGHHFGLQYSMMLKNRVGVHAGFAFRQYVYFTDLVACNYEIYQCPNSYNSTIRTVDIHVGAQVNLIKTDKIEWYVMGGINNQFMIQETFEYDMPIISDTSNPNPLPIEPPRNTSFTGGGASGFNESLSQSADFNSSFDPNGLDNATESKFMRERYLGGWYIGTGITWNFIPSMSLQFEPVIGRTFQFVGIQDKRLWSSGVNVRLNVKLGR